MISYDEVKEFYEYIIADDESPDFDENLPFGGISKDAPDVAKKAYDGYVKKYNEQKEKGIKL